MKSAIILGIGSILIFASCEKSFIVDSSVEIETSSEVFTATTESRPLTRTTLSGVINGEGSYSLYWSKGDAISISDGKNTAVYSTNDNYSTSAEFTKKNGSISNTATQYTAFYPSAITTSNMVLPATQNHVDDNVENFPMYAVSANKNLAFKNLCGIVCLSLKVEESGQVNISSISLSADKGMSGPFTIGENYAAVVSGNDGVVLKCAEPKSLYTASATYFNIIVPAGDYNPLNIKICDADGSEVNLVSEGTVSVKRSEMTRINLKIAKSSFDASLEAIPVTDSDVDFTER